jgi:hypothetical protein
MVKAFRLHTDASNGTSPFDKLIVSWNIIRREGLICKTKKVIIVRFMCFNMLRSGIKNVTFLYTVSTKRSLEDEWSDSNLILSLG